MTSRTNKPSRNHFYGWVPLFIFLIQPLMCFAQSEQTVASVDKLFLKSDSNTAFQLGKWKERANLDKRQLMLHDLVHSFPLIGMTRGELHGVLGVPEASDQFHDVYWLSSHTRSVAWWNRGEKEELGAAGARAEKIRGLAIEFIYYSDAIAKYRVCKDELLGSWKLANECPKNTRVPLRGVKMVRLQVHISEPGGANIPSEKILLPQCKGKLEQMGIKVVATSDPRIPLLCFSVSNNTSLTRDQNLNNCDAKMEVYQPGVGDNKPVLTWLYVDKTGGGYRYEPAQLVRVTFQGLLEKFRKNWRKNNDLPPDEDEKIRSLNLVFEKHLPFDSAAWKSAVNGTLRETMLCDLVASQKLFGLSPDQVHVLLGPPERDAFLRLYLQVQVEAYGCAPHSYFDVVYEGGKVTRVNYREVSSDTYPPRLLSRGWFDGKERSKR